MRSCHIYCRDILAGTLVELAGGDFTFTYHPTYLFDDDLPPVSLTLPKQADPYRSPHLFPCFIGLLAEGALAQEQCQRLRLDEQDYFGRLLSTCGGDCIGSLHVEEIKGGQA